MAKHAGGRPTKYKEEFENQAFKLTLLGMTDEQLAKYFEVNVDTLQEWKIKHSKFSDSIKAGKEDADAEVINSLYKRAKGFTQEEEVINVVSDGSAFGSSVVKTKLNKSYPPEVTALKFWLINRQRAKWTEKQEVGFTDKDGKDIPIVFNPAPGCAPIETKENG